MKRGWTILLMFSIGLNAGLLYVQFAERWDERPRSPLHYAPPQDQERRPPPPGETSRNPEEVSRIHLQRMTETLRLDRDQQQAIGKVLSESIPQIVFHEEKVHEVRLELASRYAEPKTNAEEIRSLVKELNRSQARLDSLVAETMLREVHLLTPDQRRLYVDIVPWGRPRQPQPPRQEPLERRPPPPDRG